jgi:hypothetical protein
MINTKIFGLLLILSACSQKNLIDTTIHSGITNITNMNLSLDYASGVCAPKLYPVEVYRGDFYTDDDWLPIPNGGIVEAGWGDNGMNMSRGSIIPTGFKITYFSYLENKFYTGDFKLPYDQIQNLFKEGLIGYRIKKYVTYDAMIVGMAPGGVLVVWMQSRDNQVEIGRFQAIETTMNWETFKRNTGYSREEFLRRTIDHRTEAVVNFEKNGLMLGLWDTYRIKYNWRPKFEFSEGSQVEGIDLKMYNGESSFVWGEELTKNDHKSRAITSRINLLWSDETEQKYGADIDFDEAEIFDAYKQIYRNDKEQNAELVIKYNNTRTSLELYLRSKSEEIEIEKCKIKIYKRSK